MSDILRLFTATKYMVIARVGKSMTGAEQATLILAIAGGFADNAVIVTKVLIVENMGEGLDLYEVHDDKPDVP